MGDPADAGRPREEATVNMLQPPHLEIDAAQVWRRLGYPAPSQVPSGLRAAFEQAVETGGSLLAPAAQYGVFPLDRAPTAEELGGWLDVGGVRLRSRELAFRCVGAEELAVFIATIGPHLEDEVERRFPREAMTALILDHYGSQAVIELTHQVRAALWEYGEPKGYRVGERFCPGYGDWDTAEQRKLFSLLDGRSVGVELKPSGMMRPRKAYAGVIPLGSEVREISHYERCCQP